MGANKMKLEHSVEKPLNREPPVDELVSHFLTPPNTAYDRNHGPFPYIDPDSHTIRIAGLVTDKTSLSISSLQNDFPQHSVIAALQCAGNRRHTMRTELREVDGIDWNDGACCNAVWEGPLLADVLARANPTIKPEDGHVCFDSHQTKAQDDEYYGVSVPLARCMDPSMKAILALKMNDAPLTVNHGFPVRIVLPGIAGARWTKWLDKITVQTEESANFYMQRDYKILPPTVTTKEQAADAWHTVPAIQGMPVNSVIAKPASGTSLTLDGKGGLEVCGYALPQGDDGPVVKVEVSVDEGKSWMEAELVKPTREETEDPHKAEVYRWAWCLWRIVVPAARVSTFTENTKIWSRATDAGGNRQTGERNWNLRGVAYNGYGEVKGFKIVKVNGLAAQEMARDLGRRG